MTTKFTVCGWEDSDSVTPSHRWDFNSFFMATDFLDLLTRHYPSEHNPACYVFTLQSNGVEMDRRENYDKCSWAKVLPR